jgi:hypothetical protein
VKEIDRWGVGEWNRLRRERQRGNRVVVGVCAATRERERASERAGQSTKLWRLWPKLCPLSQVHHFLFFLPVVLHRRIPCFANPLLTSSSHPVFSYSLPLPSTSCSAYKTCKESTQNVGALFYEWCYQLLEVIITLHTPKLLTNDSNPRNSALGTRNSSIIQASGRTRITFELTKNK